MTEILDVSGKAGAFKVEVREKARSIDPDKCTGCGDCISVCPVRNIIQVPTKPSLPDLSPEWSECLETALKTHGQQKSNLIAILQDINRRLHYLPREIMAHLSDLLRLPESEIYRVATFYNAFSLEPLGRHLIEVCSGTACHVKGSSRILDRIQEELQVEAGYTTEDRRFTLRTVNCMGCCAVAPAVKVDGEAYGYVKIPEIRSIISNYP